MEEYWYEHLSAPDRSFLIFEGPQTHMHVGATVIFDRGNLCDADGGIDIDRIRDYIGSRLHLIPRYRQRLSFVPWGNDPVWVDDARLNLHYHVRHASLPRPGDLRQLRRLAGRIMSQQLDRRRPLWEVYIVEGLSGGRFAMVLKTHHAVVDGVSGVDLMSVLMRPAADDSFEPGPEWVPRPVPTAVELLRDEVQRRLTVPLTLVQQLGDFLRDPAAARDYVSQRLWSTFEFVRSGVGRPAETPINQPIGPYRRCDGCSFPLAEMKAIKNQFGGTVNDVLLATVAGAVRRYLARRQTDVQGVHFRVVVPVSTRRPEEIGTSGNHVAAWLMALPIQEADVRMRYTRISRTTKRLKESKQAEGVEVLTQVAEVVDPLLALGVRVAARLHPYNLIVTNVPGPQFPLYLLSSRMLEGYPTVPLFEYQGLGVATFSYDGNLFFAINACWDLIPDLHAFVEALQTSFAELRAAARAAEPAPPPRRPRPRRAAAGADDGRARAHG